ncbi:molybdopterin synthase subunit MoaD [Modestobacter sp. DSM 44400]|uniref:MoaD/ThiS family protein n=1 Tax=Modestobacter sp. DSM 44400 TaxID=1550230 RepID=UPI00089812F1|nr:MoaD/ThiS family protein [Modestobacter sp. DSM 44400]SDY15698.1 molybdopterin synthase subunit MoaD [Modestobacter sp. DSM 44400]
MTVRVLLPRLLADCTGGRTAVDVDLGGPGTVRALLDALAADHPVFDRRVRDETGALRRHVNVYVDGEDVRRADGLATAVPPSAEVMVIQSVAGG